MTRDVIVVGGGIIGCSIAWRLAERGARVTLFEPASPGGATTRASAGMLSPLGEAESVDAPGAEGRRAFRELAAASFERWPAYVEAVQAASGMDVGYATDGKLHVAVAEAELPHLDALAAAGDAFGAERLDACAARTLEPALSDGVAGALLVRRDHRVDNRKLADAVHAAAERAGVIRRDERVVEVAHGPGGAAPGGGVTVRAGDGATLSAAWLVLAAGPWSGGIGGLPEALPVRPVRGQMFSVAAAPPGPRLTRVVETSECYLVPRGELLLVGATVDEAGWRLGPTPAAIGALARAAIRVVPEIADATLTETWAGFRPGTPDDLPILGADPDAPAVLYATGHYRNGILLAPITADAIADLVSGGHPTTDLTPFSIARFRGSTA